MAEVIVKIRFGSSTTRDEVYSNEHPYDEYKFANKAEANAFLFGVYEMDGWTAYEEVEDE